MQSTANRKDISTHRSERICIDISDSVVSVIKLDPQGVMIKAGSAKAPTLPGMPDDAYVTDLSAAIKKAAWAAKVSSGFGASCIVGVSMPDMTIQRFRWPDMPTDALLSIAATEMIPYLPGGKSLFHVGCEVLAQDGNELEVLAAAMPEEHAIAVDTACRWANFKPKRIDIRENARSRLVQRWSAPIEGAQPYTYAILDAGPGAANITFYHRGLFHNNRYFTPEFVKLGEVEDFETLMSVKAGGIGNNESAIRYDTSTLTNEITSAIDHFHRLIGSDKISCVLLMDDENIPGIEENLRASLGVPVLKPSQWVIPGIKRPSLRRTNQDAFLDAYAVGMPPLAGHECRMDLSVPNTAKADENAVPSMARQAAPPPVQPKEKPVPDVNKPWQAPGMMPEEPPVLPVMDPMPSASIPRHIPEDPLPIPQPDRPGPGHMYDPLPDDRGHYSDNPSTPIPAGYVELPEFPPELAGLGLENEQPNFDEPVIEDKYSASMAKPLSPLALDGELPVPASESETPIYHDAPFDIVSAKTDDNSGFPYAIPEDPRPGMSAKIPIIAAAALVAVILIIAVLVPLRTTSSLRNELQSIEESISNYISPDMLFMMEQERANADRQINAIRTEISTVNERMVTIRDFYLRLPALVLLPEVLESSGLDVDTITVTENPWEHNIMVSGRTNNFRGMLDGVEYLRHNFYYHYLLNISFTLAAPYDTTGVDAYGYVRYIITITANSGWAPFWLNGHVVRSWP